MGDAGGPEWAYKMREIRMKEHGSQRLPCRHVAGGCTGGFGPLMAGPSTIHRAAFVYAVG